MKVARKLLVAGGASLVLAGGVVTLPLAPSVGATHGSHHGSIKKPDNSYVLKEESNATYNVKTEISPDHHALWSTVTNKTTAQLTPTVTFNGEPADSYSGKPLDPGQSRKYIHFFSGNNFALDVTVAAEGVDPFTSSAVVNLPEPVSFQVTSTDIGTRTVTGTLVNNTAEPQTVYLKTHKKNKSVETLAANETRTVTISSSHNKDTKDADSNKRGHDERNGYHTFVRIKIATATGYHGTYLVNLGAKPSVPTPL